MSVEEIVRRHLQASEKLVAEKNTPEKARAFLLKIGILEKHSKSPHGVRLAKRFR